MKRALQAVYRPPWRLLVRLYDATAWVLTRARFLGRPIRIAGRSWVAVRSTVRAGVGGQISMGARCEVHPYAMLLAYGGSISLGDDCSVNPFAILYGQGGLRIGNGVRIAAHVVIIPANHDAGAKNVRLLDAGLRTKGITIEDDVWIGAGARILDGVCVGRGAVVGAGAVVTRSVPPGVTVVGVPAKAIHGK
jgi:acetyltransferase-like isoleucine patch superfamily enzyme